MFTIFEKAPSIKEWNTLVDSLKIRQFSALTAEEILNMDYTECKLLMHYNHQFYTLAIKALAQYVDMFLAETNEYIGEEWVTDEATPQFNSLDELLHSSVYFADDYESSRCEFVRVFMDVLWDYAQLC